MARGEKYKSQGEMRSTSESMLQIRLALSLWQQISVADWAEIRMVTLKRPNDQDSSPCMSPVRSYVGMLEDKKYKKVDSYEEDDEDMNNQRIDYEINHISIKGEKTWELTVKE
ncbi:hypothetical protein Tco_1076406 [Tanacetum coccineum]